MATTNNNVTVKYGTPVKQANPGGPKPGGGVKKKKEPIKLAQIFHIVHRLAIFVSASLYILVSFYASYVSVGLLRGKDNPTSPIEGNEFKLMRQYVGTTTIRQSPLVTNVLQSNTAPINGTIYLEPNGTSFTECWSIVEEQRDIYADAFQRSMFDALTLDLPYHMPDIAPSKMELIAPVVDCTSTVISDGDTTSGKFFFLVRDVANHNNVSILAFALSNQQYKLPARGENGPAGVGSLQLVNDLTAVSIDHQIVVSIGYPFTKFSFRAYSHVNTTVDGQWTLKSIPRFDDELSSVIVTACRTGFFIKAESEQSNVNNVLWVHETNPIEAVSRWRWVSTPVLHDSWAWVHSIQFFFAMTVLSNLIILCVATYRNLQAGKLWVGDAFVSISTSQLFNGAVVLISWFMNEYWSLHEFCFHNGYELAGLEKVTIYQAHMRADLLTIYFSACGVIGTIFRERIDPLVALLCFLLGYESRIFFMSLIPSVKDQIDEFARWFHAKGIAPPVEGQEKISPMRFWTTHNLGKRNYKFVFACLFPIFATLLIIVVYVLVRKIFYRVRPEKLHVVKSSGNTGRATSENESAMLAQKHVFTLFEIATGAELEYRFGLVSDYEACLFIKGMKFASADGIYSNGFVIANKKYLIQARDIWSVLFMKMIRARYKNIYVYEVNGSTVQQTARLVYPHTLTLTDLSNLNVNVLS